MKTSFSVAVGLVVSVLIAVPAGAVDVENTDDETHEITISGDNSEAASFDLAPGARQRDVCGMRCTVKVEGVGSIVAEEDDLVIIRDGKLSKHPKRL